MPVARARRVTRLTAAILGALLLGVAVRAAAVRPDPSVNPQADYWQAFLDRTLTGAARGYVYAINVSGRTVAAGARGEGRPLDAGNPWPLSVERPLQLASVSKPLTAAVLLDILEEQGIPVETPFWRVLRTRFPGLEPATGIEAITLADLLSHRSGFPFGYARGDADLRRVLMTRPGLRGLRVYSNINYAFARALIEVASGRDYATEMRDRLFTPAAATGFSLMVDPAQAAYVYRLGSEAGRPLAIDFTPDAGPYGWYASASDLVRVLDAIRGSGVVTAAVRQRMFDEGLGWTSVQTPAGLGYRHDGQWVSQGGEGVQTGIAVLPNDVTAVLLINTNGGFSPSTLLARGYGESLLRLFQYRSPEGVRYVRVERPVHADSVRCRTANDSALREVPGTLAAETGMTVICWGFHAGEPATPPSSIVIQ